jgi:formate-dependent nitrite reductase membrane component NrfD
MARQVRRSWIARGFWGLSLFLPGAVLALLVPHDGFMAVALFGELVALTGSLVLMGYMGFVYTSSRAIPFWNSALHPLLYVAYALRGGCAVLLAVLALAGETPTRVLLGGWLIVTLLVAVLWAYELYHAAHGDAAARRSVREVLAGRASSAFYGGILALGILLPVVLLAGVGTPSPVLLVLVALASVSGDFFMKFTAIRAGVYRPVYP